MTRTGERTIQACLVLAALIHIAPLAGVQGGDRLEAIYGITVEGPDLAILMRHRAVLFGILGVLLLASVARANLRSAAILAGLVSVVSFLALAVSTGGYNARIGTVVAVDVAALVFLLVAAVLQARVRGAGSP